MRTLVKRGHRVVNYDARGHGDSAWDPEGDYTIDAMKQDLLAVIATLSRPPVLIGASMGGSTSLVTVGESEAPVARGLVLVDIVPKPDSVGIERIQAFMMGNPEGFETLDDAYRAVAAYNPHRQASSSPGGLRKNLRLRDDGRLYWHWDPSFLTSRLRLTADVVHQRGAAAAAGVRVPALLVSGLRSDVVTQAGIADLQARIPHLQVAGVEGAGHMVAGDANDIFNAALFDFLQKLDG
jgi:non-heme chloroperoxidase